MLRDKIVLLFHMLMIAFPVYAQQNLELPIAPTAYEFEVFVTPEGIESLEDEDLVPHTEIHDWLATAVYNVNTLPEDLSKNGNTSLIPEESATQLMSYSRWLFSETSARELLGETLAPIGINLYVLLTLIVFVAIAWITIRIATLIIRFVLFIIKWIIEIIPFT